MDQQTIRDGISGQQIILQQPSSATGINNQNQHPTIVTTSGNYLSSSLAKRQRLNLGSQASELVETHHLVVAGDNEPVKFTFFQIWTLCGRFLYFHNRKGKTF